jgi:hypothetical protein
MKPGGKGDKSNMNTTIESKIVRVMAQELENERHRSKELELEIMMLRAEIDRLKEPFEHGIGCTEAEHIPDESLGKETLNHE